MNFVHELTRKPWLEQPGTDSDDGSAFLLPKATLGLRVFLIVVTVIFSLLIIAYADRMGLADWHSFRDPALLFANTALLIVSSVLMERARVRVCTGQTREVKISIVGASVFAYAFLVGQLLAWRQLADLGFFAQSNPAAAFFYLLTALHGLHLLGGLVALGRTANKVWRGDGAQASLSVELCAVYWHFLLVLWLVLFGLLLFT